MNLVRNYLDRDETPNYDGFAVIGAGLSKTGTMSLEKAFETLMKGTVYHGGRIMTCPTDELDFWHAAIKGKPVKDSELVDMLQGRGIRAGCDCPINWFYKELMRAYPDAKVVLSVRDKPETLYHSLKTTYDIINRVRTEPVMRIFFWLCGGLRRVETVLLLSDYHIECCGKTEAQALMEGPEAVTKFYHDWNEEVKRVVPKDRLLVFNVKQGWGPLCKFLGVPVPDEPFPRVNDRESIKNFNRTIGFVAYSTVLGIPVLFGVLLFYLFNYVM